MPDDPRLAVVLRVLHRELWPDALIDRTPPAMAAACRARARAIAAKVLAELDAAGE